MRECPRPNTAQIFWECAPWMSGLFLRGSLSDDVIHIGKSKCCVGPLSWTSLLDAGTNPSQVSFSKSPQRKPRKIPLAPPRTRINRCNGTSCSFGRVISRFYESLTPKPAMMPSLRLEKRHLFLVLSVRGKNGYANPPFHIQPS